MCNISIVQLVCTVNLILKRDLSFVFGKKEFRYTGRDTRECREQRKCICQTCLMSSFSDAVIGGTCKGSGQYKCDLVTETHHITPCVGPSCLYGTIRYV